MSKKLITVFGATGNQGGSVITTILSSPSLSTQFTLRAITRDTTSAKAQALASKGVELAKANLDDASTIAAAVAGSYGVFGVTDYWATANKAVEVAQGRNIVDACVSEGVGHLVWSTLPHASVITNGELSKIEHFDSKAEVAEYAAQQKTKRVGERMIVSYMLPGFFMSNLVNMIKPDASNSNIPTLSQPWNAETTWLPLLDIRGDTGKYVAGLFAAGQAADGVAVNAVSQWVHPKDVVEVVSKVAGREVLFKEQDMSVEKASKLDRIPEELTQNMLLIRDWSYYGKGEHEEKRQGESDKWLAEGTRKVVWEEWAGQQKWEW